MNHIKIKPPHFYFICSLIITACMVSCKKTEYEQIRMPYNSIDRFSIAGYGELDSLNAVLTNDTILVYWNAEHTPPAQIKPVIHVSKGATIAPASGSLVDFKTTTVYTVTAEDGTTRKYTLKPVFNKAIPRILEIVSPFRWTWEGDFDLQINGLYLFSNGGVSGIKVFAQRLRDGYEFNIPVTESLTTSTQLSVRLPKLTADLDSGVHRIWLQVGELPSNYVDVWISAPWFEKVMTSVRLKEAGGPVYLGDTLTLSYTHKLTNDLFNKYFKKEGILLNNIGCFKNFVTYVGNAPIVSFNNAELKFVLSNDKFKTHVGSYISQSILYYNYQSDATGNTQYTTNTSNPIPAASLDIAKQTIITERP